MESMQKGYSCMLMCTSGQKFGAKPRFQSLGKRAQRILGGVREEQRRRSLGKALQELILSLWEA